MFQSDLFKESLNWFLCVMDYKLTIKDYGSLGKSPLIAETFRVILYPSYVDSTPSSSIPRIKRFQHEI